MSENETTQQAPWTPLQAAYIEKLYATYRANLHFLNERAPGVFDSLMAADLPAPFEVAPDATVTIYSGQYIGGLRDFTDAGRLMLESFERKDEGTRVWVTTPHLDIAHWAGGHEGNPFFFRPIEPAFRREMVGRFRELCPDPQADRLARPNFGKKVLPLVMVFGSGFGWHLERLVDEYEIHHLILVDVDIERLHLSMFFVDYVALFQRFERHGRRLSFGVADDDAALAAYVLDAIQQYSPPYAMQGAGVFFHDFDSERVREIWRQVTRDAIRLYQAWGFFDDEIVGLRHAIENARARRPIFAGGAVPEDAVAVIVGSGPSLDALLPILHEYRERVVVISCGTAISALANSGIEPDFHVEIERTEATCHMLDTPQTHAVLARTPLLGSAILFPGVFDLSPEPMIFLKETDFGSRMFDFGDRLPRVRTNPTCTNGGVDLALKLGFRTLYLVGVDFGFLPEGRHHASASLYYNDEGVKNNGVIAGAVNYTHSMSRDNHEVPGNLVETVRATDQFTHARKVMQVVLAKNPQARVFNPNNGARIANAETIRPEEIRIEAAPETRAQAITAIKASFLVGVADDMVRNIDDLLVQFDAAVADLAALFAPPFERKADLFSRLADLQAYISHPQHEQAQIYALLHGSMQHMGRFANDCFALMRDEEKAVAYGREIFDLFLRFLAAGRENLVALREYAATGKLPDNGKINDVQ